MGVFDAITKRSERREAAAAYEARLSELDHTATREEVTAVREEAANAAGEHLTDRARAEADEDLEQRLSLASSQAYGERLHAIPLDAVVDGSWRATYDELGAAHARWMRDEHRRDQHWQAVELAFTRALDAGRVDDVALTALDAFALRVDPNGPTTTSDPWYGRFAVARLEAGLLPRQRGEARMLVQDGEEMVLSEPGTVVERFEERDGQGRLVEGTRETPVQIDASDRRIAVFGDQLLFSTRWSAVVGVAVHEDEHGTCVQLDDADTHASHVVHTPHAELVAAVARELHRRGPA